jgi:hypothetical protein
VLISIYPRMVIVVSPPWVLHIYAMHPAVYYHTTATSHLLAGAAWLTANCYNVFQMEDKYHPINQYNKPVCTIRSAENAVPLHEHTAVLSKQFEIHFLGQKSSSTDYFWRKHGSPSSWTELKNQYGWILSSFATASDDFAKCWSDLQGVSVISVVCSNLAPFFVSSVSTQYFLARFLSRSDPVDPTFLISSCMPLMLGIVF